MQEETWNFAAGENLPDGSQGLTLVEHTPQGLRIKTDTDGFLYWVNPLLHPIDTLSMKVTNTNKVDAALLWHPAGAPQGQYQFYFHIPEKSGMQTIDLVPSDESGWDWKSDQLALGFPAGADIVVHEMKWTRYSTMEKISNAWTSFWTFDEFRPYSINFLWGPLLAFNPVSRATLFDALPPLSWSADRLFYLLIGISIVAGLVFYAFDRQGGKRIAVALFGGTVIAIWIIFDLRMGSEIISYAVTDYKTFIAPPEMQKELRTHGNFYTLAEKFLPTIKKFDQFVVLTQEPSAFYANLRYMAYPSIAHRPSDDISTTKLWVVIHRPDIKIEGGRMVDSTRTYLSGSGQIIERFGTSSFLFQAQ